MLQRRQQVGQLQQCQLGCGFGLLLPLLVQVRRQLEHGLGPGGDGGGVLLRRQFARQVRSQRRMQPHVVVLQRLG